MRYLGLAIYAEGSTDESFLCPLLQRFCECVCAADAQETIEVSPLLVLTHDRQVNDWPRERRILSCAQAARPAWNLLFVHADADGDADDARRYRAQPAIDLLDAEMNGNAVGVAVVPVRETEAWAICDGSALREVMGTTLSDEAMGLPRSVQALENARDPKAILEAAARAAGPARQRGSRASSPMLAALGQQVSIERLRHLQAIQRFERDLREALARLRILPAWD